MISTVWSAAVRAFEFVTRGEARTLLIPYVMPWQEHMGTRPILTYDDVVPRNAFGKYVRKLEVDARREELRRQRAAKRSVSPLDG